MGGFEIVVIVVGVVGVLGAVATLLSGRGAWEGYGRGLLVKDSDSAPTRTVAAADSAPAGAADPTGAPHHARVGAADPTGAPYRAPAGAADPARDDEIRQMLQAANARRARRGEPVRDIEAELTRLTTAAAITPPIDDELRDEIRALVLARRRRRARRGLGTPDALDPEAEVQREIDRLSQPSGRLPRHG